MLVEYDIDAGKVWTSFPHFNLTIRDDGDVVSIIGLDESVSYVISVEHCRSDAERLLFALASLCDSQALTITRAA